MTIDEAADSLYTELNPQPSPDQLFTVGVDETVGRLLVYCSRKKDVAKVPATWCGYSVIAKHIGKIAPLGEV